MRKLTSDEPSNKMVTMDGATKVHVKHTVKSDRRSPIRHELNWIFDFADVTQEELLGLAVRPAVIIKQGEWRKSKTPLDDAVWDNVTFRVRDMINGKRKGGTPEQRARNAVSKLTAAEKQAMMKNLMEDLGLGNDPDDPDNPDDDPDDA